MFADDIETVLGESPTLLSGVTSYITQASRRGDDDSADPTSGLPTLKNLIVIPTTGPGCEFVQNDVGQAYEWPAALIIAQMRGGNHAHDLAKAWHDRLARVRNRAISGTWYLRIRCRQLPFDFGFDAGNGLAQFAFNVVAEKRPS